MHIQIKALRVFCDTVARRSFSQAAEENGISQSTASQMVQQIEERLGVTLLDRSTRPFGLTPQGEKYYEGCRSIVRQYEDLEEGVKTLHSEVVSRLTIATIYSCGLAGVKQCVEQFRRQHPQADVRVECLHPERVYEEVEEGIADLGIVSYPGKNRRLTSIPWREEPFVLACQPGSPLSEEQQVPLEALEGAQMVAFERGLAIRGELDRLLSRAKVDAPVAMEFDNIENIKRAIEAGMGVSLLPAPTVAREVEAGTLIAVPLTDETIVRPLGIIHRSDRDPNETALAFVELLKSQIHETSAPRAKAEVASV